MNTISSNAQLTAAFTLAADEIQNLFEELGFTSEEPIDRLNDKIVAILQKNIEGNVNYVEV